MSTAALASDANHAPTEPSRFTTRETGLLAFLCTEGSLFTTLIITYIIFLGEKMPGEIPGEMPTPSNSLDLGLVIINSICLLSSSLTIYFALSARKRGAHGLYLVWFGLTILLGLEFVVGTGYEWYDLMTKYHLFPSTNTFGSTFYLLIGFHCLHVLIGVVTMSIIWAFDALRWLTPKCEAPEIVSWYWHFVDGVWVVIFTLVYIVGR
ncbi:MAG: heme-copper oxidase subunit III [Pirellulales bacterium]|nr:heme-copper oxidase subunit III [Pirellulales bacterium]